MFWNFRNFRGRRANPRKIQKSRKWTIYNIGEYAWSRGVSYIKKGGRNIRIFRPFFKFQVSKMSNFILANAYLEKAPHFSTYLSLLSLCVSFLFSRSCPLTPELSLSLRIPPFPSFLSVLLALSSSLSLSPCCSLLVFDILSIFPLQNHIFLPVCDSFVSLCYLFLPLCLCLIFSPHMSSSFSLALMRLSLYEWIYMYILILIQY